MAVFVVSAVAVVGLAAAGYTYFSRPPAQAVFVKNAPLSQEQIIQNARDKLGMDCKSYYNFAVCGRSGVGRKLASSKINRDFLNLFLFKVNQHFSIVYEMLMMLNFNQGSNFNNMAQRQLE